MRENLERSWRELPGILQQDVRILLVLGGIMLLLGIAYNRGYKRTERGPVLRTPLFMIAASVAILVHHVPILTWRIGITAVACIIAGLIGRRTHPRGLWMLLVLLGAGLGLGWTIATLAIAFSVFLVLFLSPAERR